MIRTVSFRTIVLTAIASVLIVLTVLFVLFQARHLLLGPQLMVTSSPAAVVNTPQITLAGSARNISRLWLNDRQIFTDPSGNFAETVVLENGYTIVTLRAEDRYGRSELVEQSYVYTPASLLP
jgi:hypothetical protein